MCHESMHSSCLLKISSWWPIMTSKYSKVNSKYHSSNSSVAIFYILVYDNFVLEMLRLQIWVLSLTYLFLTNFISNSSIILTHLQNLKSNYLPLSIPGSQSLSSFGCIIVALSLLFFWLSLLNIFILFST